MFFLLVSIAHACLGMLIGVISWSTGNVVLWSQLIFLPSMLIGGLMIPFSMLPGVLARIALLLPATHAMNIFQGLSQNQTTAFNILWSIIVLIAGVILSCGLAVYLFSWDNRNATRRGHPAIALFTLLPYVLAAFLISPQTIN
jgi:ABC-2 type transport system permease protein